MADRLNLWQRVKLAWKLLRGPDGLKALTIVGKLSTSGTLDVDAGDVETLATEGYKKQEVVYACIRAIATSASDVPVRVMKDEAEDPDHPLAELLARPWPWLSRYELLEATLTYLSIAGCAFWWKQRSRGKRVVGLYPLRPDLMRIQAGNSLDKPIAYFEYTYSNRVYRFPPEDIVYFRYLDPLSDTAGFPPLAVAMDAVDADNMATRFLQYFFRRGAMLGGILSTESRLEQDQVDFLKEQWRQQYGGLEHWGEVAVLSAGAKYQQIGVTQREMEFPELRKMSEARICMVFGVPPIIIQAIVGLEHATYSNFGEAQKVLWVNTLSPIYGRLGDKITVDLGLEFGNDVAVLFAINEVPALQENRDAAWNRANQGVAGGWVTVNEARAEAGLPPVREGEVFLRTLATLPEGATPEMKVLAPATVLQLTAGSNGGSQRKAWADWGEERKEAHSRRRDLIARAWEGRFLDQARELFQEEAKVLKVLVQEQGGQKQVESQVAWIDVMFALKELIEARGENWREGFAPLFRALLGAQGETIAADFGIDFSLDNPLVVQWIAGYTFKFTEKLQRVTISDLGGLIGQAQDEGWSIPRMQSALTDLYDGWSRTRAEMIARTETIRSSNAGALMAYQGAGAEIKEWYNPIDQRTCLFCLEMNETTIAIGDPFWEQGQEMTIVDTAGKTQRLKFTYEQVNHPPLHPFCRCTLLAKF